MISRNLLILGAGQPGTVAKEIAESMKCFDKIGFLDDSYEIDDPNYHEESIGKLEDIEQFVTEYNYAIVAINDPTIRREWTERLEEVGYRIAILVSPRAYVSPSSQIRKGCIIEPLAGIHANTVIGIGTIVSMGAIVDHNSMVMEYCHIDCNSVVMSGAFIECGTEAEAGQIIRRDAPEIVAKKIIDSISQEQAVIDIQNIASIGRTPVNTEES